VERVGFGRVGLHGTSARHMVQLGLRHLAALPPWVDVNQLRIRFPLVDVERVLINRAYQQVILVYPPEEPA
jgi:hypothetical protein